MGGEGGFRFICDGFRVAGCGLAFHLSEQGDEALEGFLAGCLVAGYGVGGVFAGAHEAVASTVVGDGLVLFTGGLHGCDGWRDGSVDAGVVASVEAIDGSGDCGYVGRGWAVEDEGSGEVFAMGGEGEGLAAAPAEADDSDLAVGRGEMFAVVGGGVEVGVDYGRIEAGDGFDGGVLVGECSGASTVGAEAGEQIRGDDNEALRG